MSSRRLQDVFKTPWKTKKFYTEDVLKTSSRRLQYVFTKTNVCWVVFAVFILLTKIRARVFDRCTYLRYDILENEKFDVKEFITKISEEFTIGINLTPSNA